MFWSSVVLTGDPTCNVVVLCDLPFWSSVVLTGDPTLTALQPYSAAFWSSVVLTGDPTTRRRSSSARTVLEQCRPDW